LWAVLGMVLGTKHIFSDIICLNVWVMSSDRMNEEEAIMEGQAGCRKVETAEESWHHGWPVAKWNRAYLLQFQGQFPDQWHLVTSAAPTPDPPGQKMWLNRIPRGFVSTSRKQWPWRSQSILGFPGLYYLKIWWITEKGKEVK
jgi:hypothetical protein